MPGPFGGLASAVARGMSGAEEIERKRKLDAEQDTQRQIQQAAMLASFGEQGIMPEGDAPREPMQINSVLGARPQPVQSVAPQRDPAYKSLGQTGYVQGPKPKEIAAQRKQETTIRQRKAALRATAQYRGADDESLTAIAMDDDAWQDAIKYREAPKTERPSPVPQFEKIRARIQELTLSGTPLDKANVQARLEFGESPQQTGMSETQVAAREDRRTGRELQLQQNFSGEPAVKHAGLLANAVAQLRASASERTPQGDLNMLYGAVKLRDPNAVREGELALNNKARSAHTQLFAFWDRVQNGRILTDQEREQVMSLVNKTVEQQTRIVRPVQARYGAKAREFGADSSFVAPDPFEGARASGGEKPDLPSRIAELKAQGVSKEAAKVILRREGHEIP